jgi:hypothetical protein
VNHTWKNVTDGRLVQPESAEIRIPGFPPGADFEAEWWDTYARDKTILRRQDVKADRSGVIVLAVDALRTDTAMTLSRRGSQTDSLLK